ncbi:hypothetical protein NQ176_g5169 [Zarea fungicola]|uniref:Uncharacterized protein n=1 Tax=Zarea fungicola TaxID=93591 RepID=A0ACC1NAZ2_9HYPO|nr:hypothetical protein NQ176_g5169 [Lecanicillium fungicola]
MGHRALLATVDETLISKIESLPPILDAFNYRHRNQHSSSHWWSKFQLLRRSVHSLAAGLAENQALHQLPAERKSTAAKTRHKIVQKQIIARATLIRGQTLPRAYLCFSQLIADNQHATLGLMLLCALAKVNSVLSAMLPRRREAIDDKSHELLDPKLIRSAGAMLAQSTDLDSRWDADRGITMLRNRLVGSTTKLNHHVPSGPNQDKYTPQETSTLPSMEKSSRREKKNSKLKMGKGDELSSLFGSL